MDFIQIGTWQYNASVVTVEATDSGARVHFKGGGTRDFELDTATRDALMDGLPEACRHTAAKSKVKVKAAEDGE